MSATVPEQLNKHLGSWTNLTYHKGMKWPTLNSYLLEKIMWIIHTRKSLEPIQPPLLWMRLHIFRYLLQEYTRVYFQHIYREANTVSDFVTKKSLPEDISYGVNFDLYGCQIRCIFFVIIFFLFKKRRKKKSAVTINQMSFDLLF